MKNSKTVLSAAIKTVSAMDADMGGTEMKRPLEWIYTGPCIPDYPKQVWWLKKGLSFPTFSLLFEICITIRGIQDSYFHTYKATSTCASLHNLDLMMLSELCIDYECFWYNDNIWWNVCINVYYILSDNIADRWCGVGRGNSGDAQTCQ